MAPTIRNRLLWTGLLFAVCIVGFVVVIDSTHGGVEPDSKDLLNKEINAYSPQFNPAQFTFEDYDSDTDDEGDSRKLTEAISFIASHNDTVAGLDDIFVGSAGAQKSNWKYTSNSCRVDYVYPPLPLGIRVPSSPPTLLAKIVFAERKVRHVYTRFISVRTDCTLQGRIQGCTYSPNPNVAFYGDLILCSPIPNRPSHEQHGDRQ